MDLSIVFWQTAGSAFYTQIQSRPSQQAKQGVPMGYYYYAVGKDGLGSLAEPILTVSPYRTGFWHTGNCAKPNAKEVASLFYKYTSFYLFDDEADAKKTAEARAVQLFSSTATDQPQPSICETPVYRILVAYNNHPYLRVSNRLGLHEIPSEYLGNAVVLSARFAHTSAEFAFDAPESYGHILKAGSLDPVEDVIALLKDYCKPLIPFLGPLGSRGLRCHWGHHQLARARALISEITGKGPTELHAILLNRYKAALIAPDTNVTGSYIRRLAEAFRRVDECLSPPPREERNSCEL